MFTVGGARISDRGVVFHPTGSLHDPAGARASPIAHGYRSAPHQIAGRSGGQGPRGRSRTLAVPAAPPSCGSEIWIAATGKRLRIQDSSGTARGKVSTGTFLRVPDLSAVVQAYDVRGLVP